MTLKQTFVMLTSLVITSLMFSCGGGKGNAKKIAKVKPEKIEITGDLSEYLQVVDNVYEIVDDFGGKLSIKIKAIKPYSQSELVNKEIEISASILGDNNMPVSGAGEFKMFKSSKDKILSLLKKGSGEEVIELGADITEYDDAKHADKSKFFTVSSIVKENPLTSTSNNSENLSTSENKTSSADVETATKDNDNTSSADCDKFIKDYESFINSYIKLIKKYKANPTDATILSEYTEAVEQASKMENNVSLCTDTKYATKLLELQNKLAKALL